MHSALVAFLVVLSTSCTPYPQTEIDSACHGELPTHLAEMAEGILQPLVDSVYVRLTSGEEASMATKLLSEKARNCADWFQTTLRPNDNPSSSEIVKHNATLQSYLTIVLNSNDIALQLKHSSEIDRWIKNYEEIRTLRGDSDVRRP